MSDKTSEIKVRVTDTMKQAIVNLAAARGEGESVIVREALNQYIAGHESVMREEPTPYRTRAVKKAAA